MSANFLHGVETIILDKGPRPVRVVKSAVIGIIGTSAFAIKNEPLLILSPEDAAAKLGVPMAEFTLAEHVERIFAQGAATIIAVNVYDRDDHTAAVTNETVTIGENGKFKLALTLAPNTTVTVRSLDLATTYVRDEDYTFNVHGEFTVLNTELLETPATQLRVSYRRHSLSLVPEADVIGGITDGVRSGLRVFDLSKAMFGFSPRILLAPDFCETQTMVDAMISRANTMRARAIVDAPFGTSVAGAIAGHGVLGEINFGTTSSRAVLTYPKREVTDIAYGSARVIGWSTFLAGVWCKTILEKGYWWSPSNKPVLRSGDPELVITGDIADASTDANALNEAGIVTYLNVGGEYRTWGNRSAAFPSSTAPENFLSVQMTADVIHDSVEQAMLPFIDQPLTAGLIDSVQETVNAFIRTLIGRGALIDGSYCAYNPAKNPVEQLAQGQVVFDIVMMPPVAAERITFESFIDISLLANLNIQ